MGAWLRNVAAAGALCLTGDLAQHAVQLLDLDPTTKQTLSVLVSRLNYEDEYTFPSYMTLGAWCGTKRRAAVDRVAALRDLKLERDGVAVYVDARWKTTMRLDDPSDRVRSNRYYVVFARRVVDAAGAKFGRVPGTKPEAAPVEAEADWTAAPASSPAPLLIPPEPVREPGRPEAGPAGAAAAEVSPPPPGLVCRAETAEERAIREAMLAQPETADFPTMYDGEGAAAWWATAQKAQQPLPHALAALQDTARKSYSKEPLRARWNRGVSFLIAYDPKKAREHTEDNPRLSAEARKAADVAERRDKARRVRVDVAAAAELQRRGVVAAPAPAPLRTQGQELADRAREAREALARWEQTNKPP